MFKRKKISAFILSILICMSSAGVSASVSAVADEASGYEETDDGYIVSGDFSYCLDDDNNAVIAGYVGSSADVAIPDTIDGKQVKEIAANAFYECNAVSIKIPAGVDYISENPFAGCQQLKEITVDENNRTYTSKDGVLYDLYQSVPRLICYPQAKEGDSFEIPEDTEYIGASAFYGSKLKEIKLPAGLKEIAHHGLSYMESITKFDFSGTELTYFDTMICAYCTSLTEVVFPENITEIGSAVFAGCKLLENITLPETLTAVGQNAFAGTGMQEITVPESVTEIGYCAFGYDENLQPISSFTVLGVTGSAAQIYCTESDEEYEYVNNFNFVDVNDADVYYESKNFSYGSYEDFSFAMDGEEIYIVGCTSVESKIEVPAEIEGKPVTKIYNGAFFQSSASEIVLPDSIKEVKSLAFYMCSSLKTVNLPEGLALIDKEAFNGCSALESITIPASCETIGEDAFIDCSALKEFKVSGGGAYKSEDGVIYSSDGSILVAYPAAKEDESFKAPSEVREIAVSAFYGASKLEKVNISSAVTIGNYAFENCSVLESVKLSKDLEKIGECAFYNCYSLKSLRTYDKITEVGSAGFGYCYGSTGDETSGDVLVEDFKLYAPEDSGGARFAAMNGIECKTNTVSIFGANVEKVLLYVLGAAAGAAVIAAAGATAVRSAKGKKKKKQKSEEK